MCWLPTQQICLFKRIINSNSWLHMGLPKNQAMYLRASSWLFLNSAKLGAASTSLGRLFLCPSPVKNCFLMPTWPSSVQLHAFPLGSAISHQRAALSTALCYPSERSKPTQIALPRFLWLGLTTVTRHQHASLSPAPAARPPLPPASTPPSDGLLPQPGLGSRDTAARLTLIEGPRELGAHVLLRRALGGLQRHGHEEGGVGGTQAAAVRGRWGGGRRGGGGAEAKRPAMAQGEPRARRQPQQRPRAPPHRQRRAAASQRTRHSAAPALRRACAARPRRLSIWRRAEAVPWGSGFDARRAAPCLRAGTPAGSFGAGLPRPCWDRRGKKEKEKKNTCKIKTHVTAKAELEAV